MHESPRDETALAHDSSDTAASESGRAGTDLNHVAEINAVFHGTLNTLSDSGHIADSIKWTCPLCPSRSNGPVPFVLPLCPF